MLFFLQDGKKLTRYRTIYHATDGYDAKLQAYWGPVKFLHFGGAVAVPRDAFDDIVTSGDVTQVLMTLHGRAGVYHVGAARDVVGRERLDPTAQLVHPADRELLDRLAPGEATGEPVSRTVRLVHADGHTVWVLADTSTIEHPDGSPAYHVALVADITDRKRLEARLEHQAFHDSLTGLPNRARLTDLLEVAWRNRSASGHLAVLFVDLDDFKRVNDERDHDAGDELLTLVARRLRAAVRGGDGVCRYGGDEFVVVCAEVEAPEVAVGLAERIRSSIEQPFLLASGPAAIGASVGVAFADAHPSPSDLLRAADRAVGRAKASGRNRVVTAGGAT